MENVGRRMVEIAEMVVPSITAKETGRPALIRGQ